LCIFSVMRCTAFFIWDWDPVMVTILSGEAWAADIVIFAPLSFLKLVTFAPPLKIHQHHVICVWVGRLTLASEKTPFLKNIKTYLHKYEQKNLRLTTILTNIPYVFHVKCLQVNFTKTKHFIAWWPWKKWAIHKMSAL